jgi:hypothetical protein
MGHFKGRAVPIPDQFVSHEQNLRHLLAASLPANLEQQIAEYIELSGATSKEDYRKWLVLQKEIAQLGQHIIMPIIKAIYPNYPNDYTYTDVAVAEFSIVSVLKLINDENAADTLIKVISDFKGIDCLVVFAAARGLSHLTPRTQAAEVILRALSYCYAMAGDLLSPLYIYGEWAKVVVLKAITEGDKELQAGAFSALGWYISWGGWETDLQMLLAALKAPRLSARLIAIDFIAELNDINALPILEEIQKTDLGKPWYERTGSQAATEAIEYIKTHQPS